MRAPGALRWSGTIKSKTEPMLEETRPDHAIRGSVAITKLPLNCDIRKKKKENKKEKCDFLKIFFLCNFFFFLLSGLVIVHTVSLLAQEHSK